MRPTTSAQAPDEPKRNQADRPLLTPHLSTGRRSPIFPSNSNSTETETGGGTAAVTNAPYAPCSVFPIHAQRPPRPALSGWSTTVGSARNGQLYLTLSAHDGDERDEAFLVVSISWYSPRQGVQVASVRPCVMATGVEVPPRLVCHDTHT